MSAREIMTKEYIERLRSVFENFDDDNDGEVEIVILERALRAFGLNPTKDEMSDILSDCSRFNTINFNTFAYIVYHLVRATSTEKELINAFRLFDSDGVGKIKIELAKNILLNINRPFNEKHIEDIMKRLENDNRFIDYKELVRLLLAD